MINLNPFRRTDAAGFTAKDRKVVDAYIVLFDDDQAAANAYLVKHGWTQEYLNTAFEHFYPAQVVYTDSQIAAYRDAIDALNGGDEAGCVAKLAEQGLTVHDMAGCREQYWAARAAELTPADNS